jgi:hypothetical protein
MPVLFLRSAYYFADCYPSYLSLQVVDETTPTVITAQFWVTASFLASTSDVAGYINLIVGEANAGFENSNIPITLKANCIQERRFIRRF